MASSPACRASLASAPGAVSVTSTWRSTDSRTARLPAFSVGASLAACPAHNQLRTLLQDVLASRQQLRPLARIKLFELGFHKTNVVFLLFFVAFSSARGMTRGTGKVHIFHLLSL